MEDLAAVLDIDSMLVLVDCTFGNIGGATD